MTDIEEILIGVRAVHSAELAAVVRQELVHLARNDHVDAASDREHRRLEVFDDEILEGFRLVRVEDEERRVKVLVQHDRNARRIRLLDRDGIVADLADSDEFAGFSGVDHIAVGGDDRLEIPVDQVADDHVLFENGDRLVRPHLGNEGVGVALHRSLIDHNERNRFQQHQTLHLGTFTLSMMVSHS